MPEVETPTTSETTVSDAAVHCEPLGAFVEFAAQALGVEHTVEGGVAALGFEHRKHAAWPKPYQMRVAVAGETIAKLPRRVSKPSDGVAWLWRLAKLEQGALVARPASQPEAVHEFSSRLFGAYQVDGGQMHMAGCHLRDVPFLRVTTLSAGDATVVEHRYYDGAAQPVDEAQLQQLGLADVQSPDEQVLSLGRTQVEAATEPLDMSGDRFLAVTLIVAKRAEGAVQFDIGEQCAQLTFGDWTSTLAAPAFHCAASGRDTYHLAAVDDGRIVAAEAIALCEQSGARVLECERIDCVATGKKVDARLAMKCPVSGVMVLKTETTACGACQQQVSRLALSGGVCKACRDLPPAKLSDTWVAGLAEQFPALQKYRKFRAGEVGGLVRVMAIGVWRRLLVVTPAGQQQPTLVAKREGLAGPWQKVPQSEWASVLGAKHG